MRSSQQLEVHKSKSSAKCGAFRVFSAKTDSKSVICRSVSVPCRSYTCPKCRPQNYKRFRQRILTSNNKCNYTFWTLSKQRPDKLTPEFVAEYLQQWRVFWNSLRYHYPRLKYIRVLEISDNQQPHFHALFNQYTDFKVVNKLWHQATGGCHTQYQVIPSVAVAKYITKYVTKSGESSIAHEDIIFQAGVHRFAASQKLLTRADKNCTTLYYARADNDHTPLQFTQFAQYILDAYPIFGSNFFTINNQLIIITNAGANTT